MREILFKGKRIDNGEWVEGCYYESKMSGVYILEPYIEEIEEDGLIIYDDFNVYEVIPETVGQYTGLTDKNGVKIFEGDIVEYNDGYDYFKGEVTFENGAFGIGCDEIIGISNGCSDNFENLWQLFWNQEVTDEPMLYYCSVIGNIHDNPELLER